MGNAASTALKEAVDGLLSGTADVDALLSLSIAPTRAAVYAMLQPTDVRRLRQERPAALASLIAKAVHVMNHAANTLTADSFQPALIAVRLLARLLPVVFEEPEAEDQFPDRLFWQNLEPVPHAVGYPLEAAVPSVQQQQEDDAGAATAAAPVAAPPSASTFEAAGWRPQVADASGLCLGTMLVHALMRLLFAPNFTVPEWNYKNTQERLRDAAVAAAAAAAVPASTPAAAPAAAPAAVPAAAPAPSTPARPPATPVKPPTTPAASSTALRDPRLPAGFVMTEANSVWPALVWFPGVSFVTPMAQTATATEYRLDLLRLLIALCSETLYYSPDPHAPARTRFLNELTNGTAPYAPTLFFSLLNAIVVYDPVGWGVPFAGSVMGDTHEPMFNASLEALLLLLDYAPLAMDAPHQAEGAQPLAQYNVYRSLLSGLTDKGDFMKLFQCLTRLMATVPAAASALLPNAVGQVRFFEGLLVLLWKLLDDNVNFRSHILHKGDMSSLLSTILYCMWNGRASQSQIGVIHLCTFILLLLSGERDFAMALNKSFVGTLPTDLTFVGGSIFDLLALVTHRMIVDSNAALATLDSCFLTIIANVTPYVRDVGVVASSKLVNLFELFASPKFILARPGNHTFLTLLLDAFNNILQYQFTHNPVFVYALVRRKPVFDALAALTLSDDTPASLRRDSHTSVHSVVTDMSAAHAAAAIAAAPAAPLQTVPVSNSEAESASGGADGDVHATASTDGGANAEVATAAAAAAAPPAIEAATEAHTEAVPAEGEAEEEGVETDVPWRATAAWWESVKRTLPLGTVLRCTAHLLPMVEEYVRESGNSADDVAVVAFVKQVELVGILPVPHPIVLRRYEPNEYTALWFTTFTWSSIFLSLATEDTPMFDVQAIRLFQLTVV